MRSVNVAVIGYGMAGSVFHGPLIASVEGLLLSTVVSSKPDAVHRDFPCVTVTPDVGAMLADPAIDVVVVASPNSTHFTYAKMALEAGKHVVLEKPFTNTIEEAKALVDIATKSGKTLSVYQNRRYVSDFRTIKEILDKTININAENRGI